MRRRVRLGDTVKERPQESCQYQGAGCAGEYARGDGQHRFGDYHSKDCGSGCAAARVFRVCILMQGQGPKLKERVYMGLFGGEGAGVATLVPRTRLAYVAEVGTRPKFRRRGVARRLRELLQRIRQKLRRRRRQ